MKDNTKLNLLLLTSLEEINQQKAEEVISHPELDGKELSNLLEASLLGKFVNKETKQPLKLSNQTICKGLLNRLNQIDKEQNLKNESNN